MLTKHFAHLIACINKAVITHRVSTRFRLKSRRVLKFLDFLKIVRCIHYYTLENFDSDILVSRKTNRINTVSKAKHSALFVNIRFRVGVLKRIKLVSTPAKKMYLRVNRLEHMTRFNNPEIVVTSTPFSSGLMSTVNGFKFTTAGLTVCRIIMSRDTDMTNLEKIQIEQIRLFRDNIAMFGHYKV